MIIDICSSCKENLFPLVTEKFSYYNRSFSNCDHYMIFKSDIYLNIFIIFKHKKIQYSLDIYDFKVIVKNIKSSEKVIEVEGNYLNLFDINSPTDSAYHLFSKLVKLNLFK